jgi:hypothetical protein
LKVSEFQSSEFHRVSEFQGFRVFRLSKLKEFQSEIVVISETSYLITDLGQLQIYTARLSVCCVSGFRVSGFQRFRVSEFQSFRGSVFQGFRVQSFRVSEHKRLLEFQGFRVSEFRVSEFSFRVSDSQDYHSFRVSGFSVSSEFQSFVFHQSFRAGFQGFRVSGFRVFLQSRLGSLLTNLDQLCAGLAK